MKKLLCIVAAMTMVVGIQAEGEEAGPFGVGLKGIMSPDGNIMPVAVFRFAPAPIGGEIQVGQQSFENDGVNEGSMFTLQGQLLWSFIQKANSRFYAGGALGVGMIEEEAAGGPKTKDESIFNIGGLVGAEWWMADRPELAFNFDVGYYFSSYEDEPAGVKLEGTHNGILVSLGATYYF